MLRIVLVNTVLGRSYLKGSKGGWQVSISSRNYATNDRDKDHSRGITCPAKKNISTMCEKSIIYKMNISSIPQGRTRPPSTGHKPHPAR